jgi:protein TonB
MKKTEKANLENKRNIFFQIGLIVSLSLCLVSFNYSSSVDENNLIKLTPLNYEEEIIPITKTQEIIKPLIINPIESFEIIDDKEDVKNEAIIQNTETNQNDSIVQVSHEEEKEVDEIIPYYLLEEYPEFPGGESKMYEFINNNISYPKICKETNTQGKVFVQFIVNEKGKINNIEVIRGVDPNLDKEALRIVSIMPDWKPGKQRTKYVKTTFVLKINFTLL